MTAICHSRKRRFLGIDSALLRSVAPVALFSLAACGGGSTARPSPTPAPPSAPAPSPTPSPTPTPAPPPTGNVPTPAPVPTAFNTREFRQSDGPRQHNAASVWDQGFTGDGVTIAVVDTGIDQDSPEFRNRLSPASKDIYTDNRPLTGPDDHGTNVAMVAGAARDGVGVLGMAWDSTILAIRADEPGTCAGDSNADDAECSFTDSAIARSIRYAVNNGAKVINVSLGGPGGTTQELKVAVRSAVDAGALVVVAAGNDGLDQLDGFGRQMAAAGDGGVLIVGSIDENYVMSDFSNRAGDNAANYIVALGDAVCCVYETGELYVDDQGYIYLFSGTSFAAPQVSGAAALLAQAFPNLTGREIAEILLDSANDLGTQGPDRVYGMGSLDILRAFQPRGTTQIAGTAVSMALDDGTGTGSPAMGDALGTTALPTLITDKYNRAFNADLSGTLRGADVPERMHGALDTRRKAITVGNQDVAVAFSVASYGPDGRLAVQPLRLSDEQAEQSRVLAASIATRIAPDTQVGLAFAEGAGGLVARMRGQERPAFMIASDAAGDDGMFRKTDTAVALRQQLGGWGLTASVERGHNWTGSTVQDSASLWGQRLRDGVSVFSLGLDRDLGGGSVALAASWMQEDKTILGARFHDGFGMTGSETLFIDAEAGWRVAPDWRLGASVRQGFTNARTSGLLSGGSRLSSRAWSFDVEKQRLLTASDSLALRISQPLRVEGGGLNLNLPVSWDYATLTPTNAVQHLSLAPKGREINGELAWRGPLLGGFGAASVFYRRQPGHYSELPDDAGAAVRWSLSF